MRYCNTVYFWNKSLSPTAWLNCARSLHLQKKTKKNVSACVWNNSRSRPLCIQLPWNKHRAFVWILAYQGFVFFFAAYTEFSVRNVEMWNVEGNWCVLIKHTMAELNADDYPVWSCEWLKNAAHTNILNDAASLWILNLFIGTEEWKLLWVFAWTGFWIKGAICSFWEEL